MFGFFNGLAPGQLPSIIVRHEVDRGYIDGAVQLANMLCLTRFKRCDSKGTVQPWTRVNIFAITGVNPI